MCLGRLTANCGTLECKHFYFYLLSAAKVLLMLPGQENDHNKCFLLFCRSIVEAQISECSLTLQGGLRHKPSSYEPSQLFLVKISPQTPHVSPHSGATVQNSSEVFYRERLSSSLSTGSLCCRFLFQEHLQRSSGRTTQPQY